MLKECNDLETNMVVGQIQSTATGLLRASGTACVLLAGDAKAREEELNERHLHEALIGHQRFETTHTLSQGSAHC